MSVLTDKANAIASRLIKLGYVSEQDRICLEREIFSALREAGSFQFMEDVSNNEIHVKAVVRDGDGRFITMQG